MILTDTLFNRCRLVAIWWLAPQKKLLPTQRRKQFNDCHTALVLAEFSRSKPTTRIEGKTYIYSEIEIADEFRVSHITDFKGYVKKS